MAKKKKVATEPVEPVNGHVAVRDRVKELRRVRAGDLIPSDKNWKVHPKEQSAALVGILNEVGYASAVVAVEVEGGRLKIIDGHLRASVDPDQEVPVLVLDVTEAEADILLATIDPLGSLATTDAAKLSELLGAVKADDLDVNAMLSSLSAEIPKESFTPNTAPETSTSAVTQEQVDSKAQDMNVQFDEQRKLHLVQCPAEGCGKKFFVDAKNLLLELKKRDGNY